MRNRKDGKIKGPSIHKFQIQTIRVPERIGKLGQREKGEVGQNLRIQKDPQNRKN